VLGSVDLSYCVYGNGIREALVIFSQILFFAFRFQVIYMLMAILHVRLYS